MRTTRLEREIPPECQTPLNIRLPMIQNQQTIPKRTSSSRSLSGDLATGMEQSLGSNFAHNSLATTNRHQMIRCRLVNSGPHLVATSIASIPPFFLSSVLYFNVTFSAVFMP
jgi:hypothetical protein